MRRTGGGGGPAKLLAAARWISDAAWRSPRGLLGVVVISAGLSAAANATTTSATPSATEVGVGGHRAAPRGEILGLAERAVEHSGGGDLDTRCDRCHRFTHGLTHPINVAVSGRNSLGLPLANGRIDCLTCHDERAGRPHQAVQGQGRDALLRADSAASLCASCHSGSLSERATSHARGLTRAHLEEPRGRLASGRTFAAGRIASGERLPSGGLGGHALDRESEDCLGCHDGSAASDVGFHVGGNRRGREAALDGLGSHPIGVPYRNSRPRDAVQLRALDGVDHRIRLFDQRVGCGSCHSPYSGQKALLVMSNFKSALCLSCHHM